MSFLPYYFNPTIYITTPFSGEWQSLMVNFITNINLVTQRVLITTNTTLEKDENLYSRK